MENQAQFLPHNEAVQTDWLARADHEERERRTAAEAATIFDLSEEGTQRHTQYCDARDDFPVHGIDLTPLSSNEVVSLARCVTADSTPADVATSERDVTDLGSRLNWTIDHLPALDTPRGATILTAFVDSPLRGDRADAARDGLVVLTQFDHDTGVTLWGRLMRDSDKTVRDAALGLMDNVLAEHRMKPSPRALPRKGSGFYALDRVNERQLCVHTGMTKDDVRTLLESYAHAENGFGIYDIGAVALGKLAESERRDT